MSQVYEYEQRLTTSFFAFLTEIAIIKAPSLHWGPKGNTTAIMFYDMNGITYKRKGLMENGRMPNESRSNYLIIVALIPKICNM
jgi:hypothetical protein